MRNCTGKQILPIMLFVFAAFNLVSAQTLVGENIDYWYNYNAAPPGQKGGPGTGYSCFLSTEQYLGAVFLRDTTKPLIVSIDSRCHGAWYSDLYLMVPRAGLPDSALYLFNNYDPTGNTINLTNLGVHIRNLDTLYFRFNVTGFTMHGSPQSVRYTGPNRRAGDPQNWRRFDRYSSDDYSTQILAGQTYPAYRRWAVAGWLPDAAGNTTDTVEFGFEDGGDAGFNDIMFHVYGVYLNSPPGNQRLELTANPDVDTIALGDSMQFSARIIYDSMAMDGLIHTYERTALKSQIVWAVVGDTLNRPLKNGKGPGPTNVFYGTRASQVYYIEAAYTDPATNITYRNRKAIYVKPGPATHLVIEGSPWVSSSPSAGNRLGTITIDSLATQVSVWAVLRDAGGNYVSAALTATWATRDNTVAAAASGRADQGEGVITRVTNALDTTYIVATQGAFKDSIRVIVRFKYIKVATPRVNPGSGTDMWPGSRSVTISDDTAGATIMYSLNSGATWATYSTPIPITAATVLWAYATKGTYLPSDTLKVNYPWTPTRLPRPTATPAAGNIAPAGVSVVLKDDTAGVTIMYSLNGGAYVTYTTPIVLSAAATIKAYATKATYTSSDTLTVSYAWTAPKLPTPRSNLANGTNGWPGKSVVLTDDSAGVTIYCSINGSAFAVYAAPIALSSAATIKAYAIKASASASDTLTVTYTWVPNQVGTPAANLVAGTYTWLIDTLRLSDTTAGATIYYSFDNVPFSPTAWTVYDPASPLQVLHNDTLRAVAVKTNWANSYEFDAVYIIALPPVAMPTISPAPGNYSIPLDSVQLFDATPGATIYYTYGSDPFSAGTWLTYAPGEYLAVDSSATIRAIALAPGYSSSAELRAQYQILFNIDIVAAPNPFVPGVSPVSAQALGAGGNLPRWGIEITLTSALPMSNADYIVYDALGNILTDKNAAAMADNGKKGYLVWDGQNRNHRVVGSGSYLMIITASDPRGRSVQKRVMVGVKRR